MMGVLSEQDPANAIATRSRDVTSWPTGAQGGQRRGDLVVREEPLEIFLDGQPLSITMRTPGRDRDLAVGFLHGEGLVSGPEDIVGIEAEPVLVDETAAEGATPRDGSAVPSRIVVSLAEAARDRLGVRAAEARLFPASSACGVCGKRSLEDLWQRVPELEPLECSERDLAKSLGSLVQQMQERQPLFDATGGAHGAALFDLSGTCLSVAEDVGRHNAVDKIIGQQLLARKLPLHQTILVTSGRAGYEIAQKALAASVPVLAAVGAASSLALDVARLGGMSVWGFVGRDTINRYC